MVKISVTLREQGWWDLSYLHLIGQDGSWRITVGYCKLQFASAVLTYLCWRYCVSTDGFRYMASDTWHVAVNRANAFFSLSDSGVRIRKIVHLQMEQTAIYIYSFAEIGWNVSYRTSPWFTTLTTLIGTMRKKWSEGGSYILQRFKASTSVTLLGIQWSETCWDLPTKAKSKWLYLATSLQRNSPLFVAFFGF